jgi:hypothetical protein
MLQRVYTAPLHGGLRCPGRMVATRAEGPRVTPTREYREDDGSLTSSSGSADVAGQAIYADDVSCRIQHIVVLRACLEMMLRT